MENTAKFPLVLFAGLRENNCIPCFYKESFLAVSECKSLCGLWWKICRQRAVYLVSSMISSISAEFPHCQEAVRFDSCHLETCSPISSQQHNEMEKAASLSHDGKGGRRSAGEKLLQTKSRIGRRMHSYCIPPSPLSSNRELLSKERGIPKMTLDIMIQLSRQCKISRRNSGDGDAVFPCSIGPRYKHDPCWHRG